MRYLTEDELAPLDGAPATITPIGGPNSLTVTLHKVHVGTFRAEPYGADVYALRMTPEGELHASWRNPAGGYIPVVMALSVKTPLTTPHACDLSVLHGRLPSRHAHCIRCNHWWVQHLSFQAGTDVVDGDLRSGCPECGKPATDYSAWFNMRDGD